MTYFLSYFEQEECFPFEGNDLRTSMDFYFMLKIKTNKEIHSHHKRRSLFEAKAKVGGRHSTCSHVYLTSSL